MHLKSWLSPGSALNFPLQQFGSPSMQSLTLASGIYALSFPGRFYFVIEDELDSAFSGSPTSFTFNLPQSTSVDGSYQCLHLWLWNGSAMPCGEVEQSYRACPLSRVQPEL